MYEAVKNCKRVVIKIGTSSLAYSTGRLNLRRVEQIVKIISDLKNTGKEIIFVTSGATGVGAGVMGMAERPRDIKDKQAAAAVGQCELMNIYSELFRRFGHTVGQVLLTRDVIEDETKKSNAKNTFEKLLGYGVIPIVNENDTISTVESEFGDNDTLSAIVANLTDAELLILLTDTKGLYDKNPRDNDDACLISVVTEITDRLLSFASGKGSKLGTGGMITKLEAARIAMKNGIYMIISNGHTPDVLYDIFDGISVGTLFVPNKQES